MRLYSVASVQWEGPKDGQRPLKPKRNRSEIASAKPEVVSPVLVVRLGAEGKAGPVPRHAPDGPACPRDLFRRSRPVASGPHVPRDEHAARSLLHEGCLHPRVALGIERQRCPLGECHQSHSTRSSSALPSETDHADRLCAQGGAQSTSAVRRAGVARTRMLLEEPDDFRRGR